MELVAQRASRTLFGICQRNVAQSSIQVAAIGAVLNLWQSTLNDVQNVVVHIASILNLIIL